MKIKSCFPHFLLLGLLLVSQQWLDTFLTSAVTQARVTPLQILAQADTEERFYTLLQILLSAIQDTNRTAVNIVSTRAGCESLLVVIVPWCLIEELLELLTWAWQLFTCLESIYLCSAHFKTTDKNLLVSECLSFLPKTAPCVGWSKHGYLICCWVWYYQNIIDPRLCRRLYISRDNGGSDQCHPWLSALTPPYPPHTHTELTLENSTQSVATRLGLVKEIWREGETGFRASFRSKLIIAKYWAWACIIQKVTAMKGRDVSTL